MDKINFIVFEGLDLSGKSTQIKLLSDFLKKKDKEHIITREPGGTTVSEKLREIILHTEMDSLTELMLYEASRREHFINKILPAITYKKLLISDRFFDSSTAYQAYGRGLSIDTVKLLNSIVTNNIIPDKTYFIDIPVELMETRIKKRKNLDKFEKNIDFKFFTNVRKGFLEIAKSRKDYKIIDGTRQINEIQNEILLDLRF